jgi:hypothetical protein
MTALAWLSTTAEMQATAGMKATTGPQYSRDASKSRDACKSSEAATACREANYTAGTVLKSEMTAAAGTIVTSWMPTAARLPETDSREVSQQHSAGMPATAAGCHNQNVSNINRKQQEHQ